MTHRRLFVDANVFIQMQDLEDLDWLELFPALTRLEVIVSKTVVDELDTLKRDRNERRSRRARSALRKIEEASAKGPSGHTLRERPYELRLVVAFPSHGEWNSQPLLDRNKADDRLLYHLLQDGNAALLTDDAGPRILARQLGIEVYPPPANFMLPPEPSEEAKENRRLRDEIRELMDTRAEVGFRLSGVAGQVLLERAVLPPMPDELVRRALAHVRDTHRRANPRPDGPNELFRIGKRVTAADVACYHRRYDTYLGSVEGLLRNLHDRLNGEGEAVPLEFEVRNAGRQNLEDVRVKLALEGVASMTAPASILTEEDGGHPRVDLPMPPDPTKLWEGTASIAFATAMRPRVASIRQPRINHFDWLESPDGENGRGGHLLACPVLEVGCRHTDSIAIRCPGDGLVEFTLNVEVRARNLKGAREFGFPVTVQPITAPWTRAVFSCLGPSFADFDP